MTRREQKQLALLKRRYRQWLALRGVANPIEIEIPAYNSQTLWWHEVSHLANTYPQYVRENVWRGNGMYGHTDHTLLPELLNFKVLGA